MSSCEKDSLLQMETTCGTLLYELQIIWDEVGEPDSERDRMLLELEQECLQVYRRKVDQANKCRAQLRQTIADCEAELAAICSAMGERPVHIRQSEQKLGSLKEELQLIIPQVEEMRKRKSERKGLFVEIMSEIQKIVSEIRGSKEKVHLEVTLDESDLSVRKMEELQRQLQALQKEKSDRLNTVIDHVNTLHSICLVLGLDFHQTLNEVHPSLTDPEGGQSISDDTIEKLATTIARMREVKLQRMQKLQDLATTLLELWNLMDTPAEEQLVFHNATRNIAASEQEITDPNTLSLEFINCIEEEVRRLEEMKASKMKELVMKKRSELDEICRKTHLVPEYSALEYVMEAIDSGVVDPAYVLEQIELQIGKVKVEALSRKEILERVEKWSIACEEECWLEEYNRDENRYNAGRGAHLTLKRAEKARALVNKLPAMVDALVSKTRAWEKDNGIEFTYDGISLLSMLEKYTILREEKEQERRRQRDQKKIQGQLIAEQEALYGSKPSPSKPQSVRKAPRMSTGGASNRRLSLGAAIHQTPKREPLHSTKVIAHARTTTKKNDRLLQFDQLIHNQEDASSGLSAGRRGLDIAGLPVKKHSFSDVNAPETDMLEEKRKPFSPISSIASSKESNMSNMVEDLNRPPTFSEALHKTALNNSNAPVSTPYKGALVTDLENRNPMVIPPYTPKTMAVPMLTANTPAPPHNTSIKVVDVGQEEIEYSFEERRLGFMISNADQKPGMVLTALIE
ncbi:unnamed protein product [Rhodiola kirilowii]